MNSDAKKSIVATAVASILGVGSALLPEPANASVPPPPGYVWTGGLPDGFYDMTIRNTPNSGGYDFGSDGAWRSSFTFGCLPGTKGCVSQAMYDDAVASPVNGKYSGIANDGVSGTVAIKVVGGVITGMGRFEFDTIGGTAGGDFEQYGSSSGFTGSIDASGNISLTTTGILATVGAFPSLVDKAWNVDNFNGGTGTGTNFVPNSPNSNTSFDSFSTGTATNSTGTINGVAFDGYTAILVKGGSMGDKWGGFFGAQYFEVWEVSFGVDFRPFAAVPIPAAVWLFGSGLLGLVGVARRKR